VIVDEVIATNIRSISAMMCISTGQKRWTCTYRCPP